MQGPTLDQPPFQQRQMPGSQAQLQQPGAGPQEDIDAVEEIPANPAEQQEYAKYMSEVYRLMSDEKSFESLQQVMTENPEQGIADVAVALIEKAEQKLGPASDTDILEGVAEELIPELAELAEAQGTDVPEEKLEEITAVAIGEWSKKHPDRVPADQMAIIGEQAQGVLGVANSANGAANAANAQPTPPNAQGGMANA